MTPSHAKRKPKRKGKRRPGERYTNDSYCRAIRRACDAECEARRKAAAKSGATKDELAQIEPEYWRPNQLRHSAATEIRREFGLEAAQVVLGHSRADVTQVYAERDQQRAEKVARQIG
jgi:integrase